MLFRSVINVSGCAGEEFADFDARLSVGAKAKRGWEGGAGFTFGQQVVCHGAIAESREHGFGVEGIDVGRSTVQEKVNDPFGFGSVVRLTRCERCGIYWCC